MSGIDPLGSGWNAYQTPHTNRQSTPLDRVGSLLNQFADRIFRGTDRTDLSDAQATIDRLLQSVPLQRSESEGAAKWPNFRLDPPPYSGNARFETVDFRGRDEIPVEIEVTRAAQDAHLFLSFGDRDVDLGGPGPADGADKTFRIEISGPDGTEELSIASGTSIRDFAAHINSRTDQTGVEAFEAGSGIVLQSLDFGSDQFVSVNVVDAAGVQGPGIFKFADLAAGDSRLTKVDDWESGATAEERGIDPAFTIDGEPADADGRTVKLSLAGVLGVFEFSRDADVVYLDGGRVRFTLVPRFTGSSSPQGRSIDQIG